MADPSQPRHEVLIDKTVMVSMRDGTRLAADIYRPKADGRFPAIVERTPYNREESVILRTKTPQYMAERGFVFIVQDVRGRFGSEGRWEPFVDDGWGENRDGFDTITWIAEQPWCNGQVATGGGSYSGQTQMLLAPTRPPALRCGFVREAASDLARQWCYRGGAFEWAFNLDWSLRHGAFGMQRQLGLIQRAFAGEQTRFESLPLNVGPLVHHPFHWFHAILDHPDDAPFWDAFNFEKQYGEIDTPLYHLAGWFDIFLDGSLRNFTGIQKHGRSKRARSSQKLIIGPWTHGPSIQDPAFARHVGEMDFGPSAVVDFNAEMLRWYDYWLNGAETDVLKEPRVRYFMMGANEWRTADSWPPPEARGTRWYLRQEKSGSATSLNDGTLALEKPDGKEPPDAYRYDPAEPVATVGGNTLYSAMRKSNAGEETPDFASTAGPRDQRPVEPQCLSYTSVPLASDLEVVGTAAVTLFASSSCVDTDFVAKLCDVFPDGRSILVVDGILRARYRRSRSKPRLLKPKKVYRLEIDLWPTAWRFAAGHRLRLAITSSNFPRFDRNLNTGEQAATSARMDIATNTIYHDKKRPSFLSLSVMER
jgi:putative CocE/NonD family hydrolase